MDPRTAAPLIDSHCHLDYEGSEKPDHQLVAEAEAAGVVAMVNVATDIASFARVQAASEKFANVVHTIGIHPHEAETLLKEQLPLLREAARHPKCRAIGEIGLDYYYDHSPRAIQRERLRWLLDLALETELPIVVHSRDAEEDQIAALKDYVAEIPRSAEGKLSRHPGVIHCFTGTRGFGEQCLDLGFSISFSGIMTFKTAEDLRDCARAFPLERLLVETDSPFLAPVPMRGKKCEPAMVRHTALKLAELKGLPFPEVALATTRNSAALFGLAEFVPGA